MTSGEYRVTSGELFVVRNSTYTVFARELVEAASAHARARERICNVDGSSVAASCLAMIASTFTGAFLTGVIGETITIGSFWS